MSEVAKESARGKLLGMYRGRPVTKPNNKTFLSQVSGPYTLIYLCTCKFTGLKWYATTKRQIHPSQIQTFEAYSYACRFKFSISQYPDWFQGASELIKQHGWYSTPGSNKSGEKNTKGVSRDHRLSVSDGYRLGVDPSLMSHPANCRLVTHVENQRKNSKSEITLDQLKEEIARFQP
jgi:hypothetical protein